MSHEGEKTLFLRTDGAMDKMQFAMHLMNRLPIAQVTEGYDYEDWEESMQIIQMLTRRYNAKVSSDDITPQFTEKIMFGITGELRRYDIGCLDCAYRDYIDTIGA